MADKRRQSEEDEERFEACLEEAGWPGESGSRALTDEQRPLFEEAAIGCADTLFPGTPVIDEAEWRLHFERTLDTRDCLVAQGFAIPEPPSEDAWVEAALRDEQIWVPFQFVIDGVMSGSIQMTQSEFDELLVECPQSGFVNTASF